MAKNVPVKKQESAVMVTEEMPEWMKDQTSQRGSENVGTEDIVIPRLEVIQALSPAVKKGDPGFIKGAESGMLTNSVTKQLYGDDVFVVPVYYMKQWLVWKARKFVDEKGREQTTEGGFFGAFNSEQEAKERAEQEVASGLNPRAVEILDTPQHLCLLINRDTGKTEEVMMSMPRTKAKISRQWNSMVRLAGGDRFSRVYRIGTSLEKNARGDFYNFSVAASGFPNQAVFKQAEALYEQIAAGTRRVVMDVTPEGGATGDDDSEY